MQKVDARDTGKTQISTATMTLVDKKDRKRVRKLKLFSKEFSANMKVGQELSFKKDQVKFLKIKIFEKENYKSVIANFEIIVIKGIKQAFLLNLDKSLMVQHFQTQLLH